MAEIQGIITANNTPIEVNIIGSGPPGRNGRDGFSPIISVSDISGGHAITIQTAYETQTFNVMDGQSGTSSWSQLSDKPFDSIGENLKVVDGRLTVDTAGSIEEDNTKPITSAAVYTEVGNIAVLLAAI